MQETLKLKDCQTFKQNISKSHLYITENCSFTFNFFLHFDSRLEIKKETYFLLQLLN